MASGNNEFQVEFSDASFTQRWQRRLFPIGYKKEFKALFTLAWPAIVTSFFQFLLLSQNVIFSGHLGKEELDAVALANSFINVLGFVIGIGLSTACDTLFSQTFGTANKTRVGMYLQRSFLVMYMFMFPLWTIWLNMEPILIAIGQDRAIARLAANYMTVAIPALLFQYTFLILARYMQNQGVVVPPMIAAILGNIVSAVMQYFMIYVSNRGYIASAIALDCGVFCMVLYELLYIFISKMYVHTWAGCDRESIYDVGMFLRLAIPGVMMVSMETWCFEIGTLLSGLLGTTDLGAQSVIFQIDTLAFMIPLGMSVAVNIRVGQQLGEMNALGAMTTYRVAVTMILTTSTTVCILIIALKDVLPWVFTGDIEVKTLASSVLPLIAPFQIFDGLAAVSSGTLRGAGHQVRGAAVSLFGFYVLALPIGISLAFTTSLRVSGFWVGLLVGIATETVIFSILVYRLNWSQECCKAQERAGISMDPKDDKLGKQAQESGEQSSEKAPLISQSYEKRERHQTATRAMHSSTLGSLRDARISLTRPRIVDVETSHYDPSVFCQKVILRVLTYVVLIVVLFVGVILHICVPIDPGDTFCSRVDKTQSTNSTVPYTTLSAFTTVST